MLKTKNMTKIGKDLENLLTSDYKDAMAESHMTAWFERHQGQTKDELSFDLNVNHDDSLEIENTESELGRELTDTEIDHVVDEFHSAIIDNVELVDNVVVGWWDTCGSLNETF